MLALNTEEHTLETIPSDGTILPNHETTLPNDGESTEKSLTKRCGFRPRIHGQISTEGAQEHFSKHCAIRKIHACPGRPRQEPGQEPGQEPVHRTKKKTSQPQQSIFHK